jgi:hypothetical protein
VHIRRRVYIVTISSTCYTAASSTALGNFRAVGGIRRVRSSRRNRKCSQSRSGRIRQCRIRFRASCIEQIVITRDGRLVHKSHAYDSDGVRRMSENIEDHVGQAVASIGDAQRALSVAFDAKGRWFFFCATQNARPRHLSGNLSYHQPVPAYTARTPPKLAIVPRGGVSITSTPSGETRWLVLESNSNRNFTATAVGSSGSEL